MSQPYCQVRILTPDERRFTVDFPSVAASPRGERHLHDHLFPNSGRGEDAVCVIRDVTEQVRTAERALQLFRITQEAASNAHRHGRARRAGIRLVQRDGGVTLPVEDDGRGCDAEPPPATSKEAGRRGLGLHRMQYRATLLGGALTIGPGGNRVACAFDLPLHRSVAAA